MNLFQNNAEKNEFILTNLSEIDSDAGGYTLVGVSEEFGVTEEAPSIPLETAIKEYGADAITAGYSIQVI